MQETVVTRRALAIAIVGSTAIACLPDAAFECGEGKRCFLAVDGRCEAGNCIYPDMSCDSNERYSPYAAPSVAGTCWPGSGSSESSATSSSTTIASSSDVDGSDTGPPPDPAGWWDCAWRHRLRVTFAGDPGPPLVDFTVLVAIDLRMLPGTFADAGADLRFVDDDGETLLPHELERWDPAGTSLAWVRVPELRTAADDAIHLYWDNPDASPPPPANAWDAHHVGVWHLGADVRDSTPTGAHGSDDSLGPIAGRIGDAREFTLDTPTTINVGSASALDDAFAEGGTVMAWVRIAALPDGEVARVAGKTLSDPGHVGWKLFAVGDPVEPGASRMTLGFHRTFDTNPACWQGPTDALAIDDTWHLLAATFCDTADGCGAPCLDDCSNDDCSPGDEPAPRLFLDGVPVLTLVTRTPGDSAVSDADEQLVIGRGPSGGEPFAGAIDELRLARTIRCDSWMRAEYLSMTGALAVLGAPEASTCPRSPTPYSARCITPPPTAVAALLGARRTPGTPSASRLATAAADDVLHAHRIRGRAPS